jgi:hypothetical protein
MLTQDMLREVLPAHLKSAATPSLLNKVNNLTADPEFNETLRQNFVSYTGVLKEGRFKVSDYLNAVAYVSLKLLGFTNQESYSRTFPARYQALVARGADEKEISAYVSQYNKNKLVNLILEQTLVPTWVLNADVYQKAINRQAWLMDNAKSELVQMQAANSILTHLKKPETKHEIDLNLGVQESAGLKELKGMLVDLAQQQQNAIGQGIHTKTIAHQPLVPEQKKVDPTAPDAQVVSPNPGKP